MYDAEGIVGARYYSGSQVTEYEYVKDGFNNVVAIVKDNRIVIKYFYDIWGNLINTFPEVPTDPFAKINPIRYRSYYYDTETELYYLQTRYYDSTGHSILLVILGITVTVLVGGAIASLGATIAMAVPWGAGLAVAALSGLAAGVLGE